MKKYLLVILVLLFAIPVFGQENQYDGSRVGFFEHTTGGDANAMDSITSPVDNKIVFIFGTINGLPSHSIYRFDIDSSATEEGQTNIESGSGVGRWIQLVPFYVFGTAGELTGVTDQKGVIKWEIDP